MLPQGIKELKLSLLHNFKFRFDWIHEKMLDAPHKKWKKTFYQGFRSVNVTNPQYHADLVTFTREVLNGKLHFLWVLKVNNRNNKIRCKICSELTVMTPERRQNFRKTAISYPLICTRICTCQGVRNISFSEILG